MRHPPPGPPHPNHGSGPRHPEPTAQRADDDRPADRPAGRGRRLRCPRARTNGARCSATSPIARNRSPHARCGTDTRGRAAAPLAAPGTSRTRGNRGPGCGQGVARRGSVRAPPHSRAWRRQTVTRRRHEDTRGMPTPPWTDVRQHTPDPRHQRRAAPSHLRIAQLGSAVNCSRTFACAPATRIGRSPIGNGHYPWPARRLTGSLGITGPRSGGHTSANRSRMIKAVCLRPDTQRYGGNRPRRFLQARNHIARTPASSLRATPDPITDK